MHKRFALGEDPAVGVSQHSLALVSLLMFRPIQVPGTISTTAKLDFPTGVGRITRVGFMGDAAVFSMLPSSPRDEPVVFKFPRCSMPRNFQDRSALSSIWACVAGVTKACGGLTLSPFQL